MPTALITGASSGIGLEFAHQLAARGEDLVLVARDELRLAERQRQLTERYQVQVQTLSADLTDAVDCRVVAERISSTERPVDRLINNAGMGLYRRFGSAPLADEEQMLDLNVRAVLRLTYAAVPAMTERGRGQIINVSSVAGFVPRAGNASYSASKAWVTQFSEGLALQLRGTGVQVCVICPGFTHTEFHDRASADMSAVPKRLWLDASAVVAEGLADADAGKPLSVPSRQYKALVSAARLAPRATLRAVMARRGL